jgi:hypothetical protein
MVQIMLSGRKININILGRPPPPIFKYITGRIFIDNEK